MNHKPIFPDCAFPDACQCAERGYEHEADSCQVPRVAAAAELLGVPTEGLFRTRPKRTRAAAISRGSVMPLPDSGDLIRDLQTAIHAAQGENFAPCEDAKLRALIDAEREGAALRAEAGMRDGPLMVVLFAVEETLRSGLRVGLWLMFGNTTAGDAVWWMISPLGQHRGERRAISCATKQLADEVLELLRLAGGETEEL
jgi:hypothetical protein